MTRNLNDKMLGGVLSGIANSLGMSTGLLRVIFIVLYLGIGGLSSYSNMEGLRESYKLACILNHF